MNDPNEQHGREHGVSASPKRRGRAGRPWFGRAGTPVVASLCVHGVLLAALVRVTIVGPGSTRADRLTDATGDGVETVLTLAPQAEPTPVPPATPEVIAPEPPASPPTPPPASKAVAAAPPVVRPDALIDATGPVVPAPASVARVERPKGPTAVRSASAGEPTAKVSSPSPVSFAGVQASRASRVVYVVDASGPMTGSLPFVKAELARSVSRLLPSQSFQVVVFRDPGAGVPAPAVQTFGGGTSLLDATDATKVSLGAWLAAIEPGGGSDLRPGLRAAFAMSPPPDLVFLLTRRIRRTGNPALAEQQLRGTLAELNALNARDPRSGQRPTIIKTLQFLDEDPTGLLPAIAREHGDASDAYRVVLPGMR